MIDSLEQKPKKPPPIANDEFLLAMPSKSPFSKESYNPNKHGGEKTFYRNSGNKHIPSRGL